jgi:TetR/AcrR family transcriptional regulator
MAREKDSAKSREDILKAAEAEFSQKGLFGTRVDEIAKTAGINKRMIYEYFGCKVDLYRKVLQVAYHRIGSVGQTLIQPQDSYTDAIRKVVSFYFEYLDANPAYVNLILWENLNRGEFIAEIDPPDIRQPMLIQLREVLERDKKDGLIRQDIDTDQILITLLTSTFAYFSNRYTLSKLMQFDLTKKQSIEKKADDLAQMIMTYIANK